MPRDPEPPPELHRATWSRRTVLTAGLVGVAGLYSASRLLPSATAAPVVTVANASFEDGPVGRAAPSWTIA